MATRPARYIYAVDRTEVYPDRRKRIVNVPDHGDLTIKFLSSQPPYNHVVTRDFPIFIEKYGHLDHLIIMVTHEALKLIDHNYVRGQDFELIIDEDPKLWLSGTMDLDASRPFWAATYDLEPLGEGFSRLAIRGDGPSLMSITRDELTQGLARFHNRVRRGNVVVDLGSWADLSTRLRLNYFTIWDVRDLTAYVGVTILANAFDRLVSAHLIRTLYPEIELRPLDLGRDEAWAPRDLHINYVAHDHVAGSHFFGKTDEGEAAVLAWAKWVEGMVTDRNHFYAANKSRRLDLPGVQVSPKIAGTNAYRDLTECSILYSAKASPAENSMFASLTNGAIDREAVRRDREFEDLIQIVFRSSLRVAQDTRPVTVNVYDRDQAEFLQTYFRDAGFPFATTLTHHDIGVRKAKAKPGPKPRAKAPISAAERAKAYRIRKKAGTISKPDSAR
ncbi:hypothetical protein [Brevundimonas sp.]|uniref:hypothetical protein n=1 Tax=Brevundimonas sp. TaxID=1871086 RepID=UPI0035AF9F89